MASPAFPSTTVKSNCWSSGLSSSFLEISPTYLAAMSAHHTHGSYMMLNIIAVSFACLHVYAVHKREWNCDTVIVWRHSNWNTSCMISLTKPYYTWKRVRTRESSIVSSFYQWGAMHASNSHHMFIWNSQEVRTVLPARYPPRSLPTLHQTNLLTQKASRIRIDILADVRCLVRWTLDFTVYLLPSKQKDMLMRPWI